mgnify:CR=1 FL=1|jgi:hypothetical protein
MVQTKKVSFKSKSGSQIKMEGKNISMRNLENIMEVENDGSPCVIKPKVNVDFSKSMDIKL